MEEVRSVINKLLVEVFNDILIMEETALKNGSFSDVSITEVHTVEAIGMYEKPPVSEVARRLRVTSGTLSVAVNNLVKKGYVERIRSEEDRRVVKLSLTKKGRVLYRVHRQFHTETVKEAVSGLTPQEEELLAAAFSNLHQYLENKIGEHLEK